MTHSTKDHNSKYLNKTQSFYTHYTLNDFISTKTMHIISFIQNCMITVQNGICSYFTTPIKHCQSRDNKIKTFGKLCIWWDTCLIVASHQEGTFWLPSQPNVNEPRPASLSCGKHCMTFAWFYWLVSMGLGPQWFGLIFSVCHLIMVSRDSHTLDVGTLSKNLSRASISLKEMFTNYKSNKCKTVKSIY